MNQIQTATQKTVATILGVDKKHLVKVEQLQTFAAKRTRFRQITTQIKLKFTKTSSSPRSWIIKKNHQYFLTSQRSVKQVREFVKQTGILSTPNKKPGRKIREEIITKVIEFYAKCLVAEKVCSDSTLVGLIVIKNHTFFVKSYLVFLHLQTIAFLFEFLLTASHIELASSVNWFFLQCY